MSQNQYFSLKGDCFIKEVGSSANPRFLGNISEGQFSMTRETITLKSTGNTSGDLAEEETSKSAELSLTLNSMQADNIALVLYGVTADQEAGTDVDFTLPAMAEGEMYKLSAVNITECTIATLTEGTDYTLLPLSGIIVALTTIAAGKTGTFSNGTAKKTGMFQHSGKEYELHYASENSGKYIIFKRWKPNPASNFSLISTEFSSFAIAGKLLVKAGVTGPLGGYAEVHDAKAAA